MNAPLSAHVVTATQPILLNEDIGGGIRILTLNRPEARNSLSEAMMSALSETLASIAADKAVRAVVLAANGPVFSAGHDLKELTAARAAGDGGRAYTKQVMETCSALMQAILQLPQPVIAAVEGTATAAGCQLVATCDLAIASSTAKFCTPGVQIGLFCSTPMVALTRNLAAKHAMEMLLTGETILAEDALRIGLINRVVEPGTARDEGIRFARKIASKSPVAVKFGKEAFYRQLEMGIAEAYRCASDVMVENMLTPDAEEGIGAFIEKREPKWGNQ